MRQLSPQRPNPLPADTNPLAKSARMIDDEAFARQLLQTNPAEGCSWLFRRYHSLLCNHALRFVYSREVAEDIVGEVFCALWAERSFDRITSSYRAYLLQAVRHRSLNYLRWEISRRTASSVNAEPINYQTFGFSDSPADTLQFDELYATINQTITSLPPQCRRVFMMSRFEQKSYRDIANELSISVKAVEGNISRALATLRRVLNDGFLALLFFFSFI